MPVHGFLFILEYFVLGLLESVFGGREGKVRGRRGGGAAGHLLLAVVPQGLVPADGGGEAQRPQPGQAHAAGEVVVLATPA